MLQGKRLIQSLLAKSGYRLVRVRSDEQYKPTALDAENSIGMLHTVLPAVEHHAVTGQWPTPGFLRGYFNPQRLAMVRLLLDQCDAEGVPIAGRRVMDVGCHAGCLLRLVGARYPDVWLFGCDISEIKLTMARRACPDAEVFFSSLADLPRETKYDVLFLTEVLEHLVDPEAAVRRLFEVLADGGTLILSVPDGREDHFPALTYNPEFRSYGGHINFWSPEGWNYFLSRVAPDRRVRTAKLPTGQLFAAISHVPAPVSVP